MIPEGWYNSRISDLFDNLDNIRRPIKKSDRLKMKGSIPYYGACGIIDWVNEYLFDEPILLIGEDGENLLSKQLPLAFKVTGKSFVNNHAHVYRPNGKCLIDYIVPYFNIINMKRYVSGSAQPKLNKEQANSIIVSFPPLPEQKKIASILSSVDEAIEATQKVIDQTEKVKKGLLQELLTKGIGHTEFKKTEIGEIPVEWELVKLKSISQKIGSGVTPKGGQKSYLKEGIPLFRSQNILWGKLKTDNIAYISLDQHNKMKNSQLKPFDTLLNITGASIGRSAVVPENIIHGNVNQHVCIIRPFNVMKSYYLTYYLNSQNGQRQIEMFQAGGNREGLNFQQIGSFLITKPPLKEQVQIISILSSVDESIQQATNKKEQLLKVKKGLMQDLLTGKVRVKV